MKKILWICALLLLAACAREEANITPTNGNTVQEQAQDNRGESIKEAAVLKNFFLKDGSTAYFKGEGNEYAQFKAKTQWLNDRFVNVYEDNGGTVFLRTFRIDDNKIVVVQEQGEAYEPFTPTEKELKAMTPLYTYLQLPLEKDATFDGWVVIDSQATIQTPLKTFEQVIIIEKKNEDGSINRKYFAKGYGEIKREFIMKDGEQQSIISSTIEKIE